LTFGVVEAGGKFTAGVNDTRGHIIPGDTGGKFATGL
jgi:hypothetical protein